ncbi:MAG: hypothetical protein K2X74_05595 [Acetobacteraceae bacterium]|nr:hypothetical protein [Acetobacteraceae bacterium]
MLLGQVLLSNGAVTEGDVATAVEAQKRAGGRLGDILVAMGKVGVDEVEEALGNLPPAPASLEETGIPLTDLLDLMTKTMASGAVDTVTRLSEEMRLPPRLMRDLMQHASSRMLIEAMGVGAVASGMAVQQPRYTLSIRGREWAQQAFTRNGYVGPCPVPLAVYADRIRRQTINRERVPPDAVARALSGLLGAERLIAQVGPAINSGRTMLLYGPAGNGKTTVAQLIGSIFESTVYVPFAFETSGQIVRVFDPDIHREVPSPEDAYLAANPTSIRARGLDRRWVPCARPFVVTGGELTLEMLDLGFNPITKFYEAPLHVKALNGIFLIDDFGRQLVRPETLLNRWIVPMESRVDYLKLQSGKSFLLPFDELVVFSTNMSPHQLMDPAFMRRIPYKIEVRGPSEAEFGGIFRRVADSRGLPVTEEAIAFVLDELVRRRGMTLAGFQPGFIVDQVLSSCRFEGVPPRVDEARLVAAIDNLDTRE